jgi:carbamate kinase
MHIPRSVPDALNAWEFVPGSMGPKVQAACEFARGSGSVAGIRRLEDVSAMLAGEAGTRIDTAASETQRWGPA